MAKPPTKHCESEAEYETRLHREGWYEYLAKARAGRDTNPSSGEVRSGISEAERAVVLLLANAWNAYLELPVEHPNEQAEFCAAIHTCQDKVLARAGRREMNT